MAKKKKPAGKGGAREGAGRPPREIPRVKMTLELEPEDAQAFRAACKKSKLSQADQFHEDQVKLGRLK